MNRLNVDAEPYVPVCIQDVQRRAETAQRALEERSIFMTFSSGSPLTEQEISHHFAREYGHCVESVYVHPKLNRDPEFGRIVFTTASFPRRILGNREVVKILVNKKPVWLKKYVPQSRHNDS